MRTIWVLLWKYPDGSAGGAIKAFEENAHAVELSNILQTYTDDTRDFYIAEIPFDARLGVDVA